MSSRRRWGAPRATLAAAPRSCQGSVAVEFALVVPVIIVIGVGIVDFGMLAAKSAGLVASARIGGEYARHHPLDTTGIQYSMQSAMSSAPALTFPTKFAWSCECDDATPIACSQSCSTNGRPGPNRVFMRVSASQIFTPLVPWPGFPTILTAIAEVRLQ
jgi:Flp pilus assembly protein TadG